MKTNASIIVFVFIAASAAHAQQFIQAVPAPRTQPGARVSRQPIPPLIDLSAGAAREQRSDATMGRNRLLHATNVPLTFRNRSAADFAGAFEYFFFAKSGATSFKITASQRDALILKTGETRKREIGSPSSRETVAGWYVRLIDADGALVTEVASKPEYLALGTDADALEKLGKEYAARTEDERKLQAAALRAAR